MRHQKSGRKLNRNSAHRKALFKNLSLALIEHNLDVIKTADWIIDLGPEGGSQGGQLIANVSPEKVAKDKKSFTGKYLKEMIS